jgi:aerobic carbon-monoxide dehydrogenase medium subunit
LKPAAFDYVVARDAAHASALLVRANDGTKLIAGSQSLGPMLNLRLARPGTLVDISRAASLRKIKDEGDAIVYGAAVTHAEIEDNVVPDATPGWLASVARRIAYRAVRNRGTIGGSLAHADPAADWVNVLTALAAEVILRRDDASRTVALPTFFTGPLATVLQRDEMIVGIRIRKRGPSARWGYWKYCVKVGDFAKASAAVLIDAECGEIRVLLGAIERPPMLLDDAADIVEGRRDLTEIVTLAAPHLSKESRALHAAALQRAIAMTTSRTEPVA